MKGHDALCLEMQDLDVGRIIQVPWLNYREREESPAEKDHQDEEAEHRIECSHPQDL